MIDRHYIGLPPGAGGMTSLTHIRSHRMSGRFIGGAGAGVTGRTAIGGLLMREWDDQRYPNIYRMAEFTCVGGLRMCRRFICGVGAGVTGRTAIGGLVMLERHD